jgi:hypothetical protein
MAEVETCPICGDTLGVVEGMFTDFYTHLLTVHEKEPEVIALFYDRTLKMLISMMRAE